MSDKLAITIKNLQYQDNKVKIKSHVSFKVKFKRNKIAL